MSNSGAKAALKGYRLQTLYTLVEILNSDNADNIFQPEGEEDLAIHNNDQLIRVIQVKAKSENLTLSSFSPDKKDSFFHRVSQLLNSYPQLSIEVVSFGKVGNEIEKAWIDKDISNRNSISKKLISHGIDQKRIEDFFDKIKWTIVSEKELQDRLYEHLEKTIVAGNSENAFSLLMAWLYHAAEHRTKISKQELINKIYAVGKYLSERAAHHQEWFNSINPLIEENKNIQYSNLAEEFYKGVSARFSHIQAGLDIYRTEQINKIDLAFKNGQKTVIVHGASGQGKTTLAYRYLHDFVPEDWRFQINFIENRSHAEKIALAIADHLSVFKADLYLYIDVSPRDLEWTALVKSLLQKHNVKILITIREEDLARQNISNAELNFPVTVPLQFHKSEAKIIYQNLINKKVANPYPSFTDAWTRFGGNGALLEYIYFLTQTESLKDKLAFQIKRLREEIRQQKLEAGALKLLFCCAVATAYESRIQIIEIIKSINLFDAKGTFELFEKEYLIRCSMDERYIEPLHPLRSKLLVEILTDSDFNPWINAATTILPCIVESDLENFLLYAFVENPQEYDAIYQKLSELKFNSWRGYAGISRALIWYGVYTYVANNSDIIEKVRSIVGDAWGLLLPYPATLFNDHTNKSILENYKYLEDTNPDVVDKLLQLTSQVSSSEIIYQGLRYWLNNKTITARKSDNEVDWLSISEVLFWMGWLRINSKYDISWVLQENIFSKIESIDVLSEFTLAMYYYDNNTYQKFISKNKVEIELLFQLKTNTLWLEYKQNNPIAHYIVTNHRENNSFSESLNEKTVYCAETLRKLFPDHEYFGAKGYGHQVPFIELPFDESNKPSILKSSLFIKRLVNINSTYVNLADYTHRPNDWKTYTDEIILTRKKIIDGLSCLNKSLISYFKNKKSQSIIGGQIDSYYWGQLSKFNNIGFSMFPKVTVDAWGYTSEGAKDNSKDEKSKIPKSVSASVTLLQYKNYKKSWSDYLMSMINFFNQSDLILAVNGFIGRLPQSQHEAFFKKSEELGRPYTAHTVHLTVINLNDAKCNLVKFQLEFRDKFKEIIDLNALKKLEEQETSKIEKSWNLWYQFAYHPERQWKESADVKAAAITRKTFTDLLNSIKKALSLNTALTWQAKLLSESYCFEQEPALWIGLQLENLFALDTAYSEIVEILTDAIRPVEYKDLKYFVMSNHWQKIIIVPMIENKTLNNIAWQLLTSLFVGNEPVLNADKPWFLIPQQLSEDAINYFQFEQAQTEHFEKLQLLKEKLAKIYEITVHFSNFIEVVPRLNLTGEKVLSEYLSTFQESLAENISAADDIISELKTIMNDNAEKLAALEICEHSIYFCGKPKNNQITINLGVCKEWALIIQEALGVLQLGLWQIY